MILNVDGTSKVTIFDLEIADGLGATGVGISLPTGNTATLTLVRAQVNRNAGGGISSSGGALVISQSTITGNAGGAISITGSQFDLENNFIGKNGSGTSFFGGIQISQISGTGAHKIDFNTIAQNVGASTVNTGITCSSVLVALTFSNNIVYGNTVAGGGVQVGGANCACTYSDVGPDTITGTGNINMDPMFVNQTQNNFHILSGSPAKDAADPAATLTIDVDGDPRPQGPRRDMGADEYKP